MRLLALISCLVLVTVSAAYGRTWHVPAEAPTIQAGIDSAEAGDVVEIACGTYSDCSTIAYDAWHEATRLVCIDMKTGITLRSESGDPSCVVVDAAEQGGVLFCAQVTDALIEGITFTGGYSNQLWSGSGGGMFCIQSSITLRDCIFTENRTDDHGGGAMIFYCSPLLERCTFSYNSAGTSGGGAFVSTGDAYFSDCLFHLNTSNANAYSKGAGVFFDGQGNPSMFTCQILGNIAAESGGGIISNVGPVLMLSGCLVSGNVASYGAGVWGHTEGSISMTNCSVNDNTGELGGGVYLNGGHDLFAGNTDIIGNTAATAPGGFIDTGSTAHLTCCAIEPEYWTGSGTIILDNENCTISAESTTWGALKAMFR